jgi:hypothetical protein
VGDKVLYFNNLYESVIDNNRVKNPRKYENISTWSANIPYQVSNVVEYNKDFYVYSGLGTATSSTPNNDTLNWNHNRLSEDNGVNYFTKIDKDSINKKFYLHINKYLIYIFLKQL